LGFDGAEARLPSVDSSVRRIFPCDFGIVTSTLRWIRARRRRIRPRSSRWQNPGQHGSETCQSSSPGMERERGFFCCLRFGLAASIVDALAQDGAGRSALLGCARGARTCKPADASAARSTGRDTTAPFSSSAGTELLPDCGSCITSLGFPYRRRLAHDARSTVRRLVRAAIEQPATFVIATTIRALFCHGRGQSVNIDFQDAVWGPVTVMTWHRCSRIWLLAWRRQLVREWPGIIATAARRRDFALLRSDPERFHALVRP